ncbi:MAG TPA: phosphoribosylamine--glycine ligase [Verrucomicrobia bacterium]|nr:MAG: phosphoribosylamine--glycine ligase [Lentisphaerae bacterium GWF2_57_35]HBA85472.1 phosphoribosylamine--glycine ligase [Verrucomicrobiota bacterium]
MTVLVIGGGGREHALVWKLANDSRRPVVFCAPGNAGTAGLAQNLDLAATDVEGLLAWALEHRPDLTVVGPEAPLCAGLVDRFQASGLRVFGPSQAAAQLEGSKIFSKEVMEAAGVPTAKAAKFTEAAAAAAYVRGQSFPLVVKADGLAAGKGVVICQSPEEADAAIDEMLVKGVFGAAGRSVLIEEFLDGEEASILALVDGREIVLLASAQDHKRIFDNDQGPNTGGMGAYCPASVVKRDLWPVIREQVFERTLAELRRRGIVYKGVLYAGLMIGSRGPKVLEFNCRFGDPETQAILPRLAGDLLPALEACVDGTLKDRMVQWKPEACVCIVMAAGGYPGSYATGDAIEGLDEAGKLRDVVVFHAGTKLVEGKTATAGGRVLGVTALGKDLKDAVGRAYLAAGKIQFNGAQYRKDIAARAL